MSMAFIPAFVTLGPCSSIRKLHGHSQGVVTNQTSRNRTSLRPRIYTSTGSPLYRLSQWHGGGKIPVNKRMCCESEDDNNRPFPSSALMILYSKVYDFDQYQFARNESQPNSSITRLVQQLRVCQILLAVNIAVFLIQALSGPGILMAGAKVNSAIASGQYYRLFSPMFLHASATHLAINSFSLHSTGPSVESWFGKRRFLWLYLVSGICGNALSFACTPTPAVGASGAIFGLVGASAVILARHSKLLGPRARKGLQSLAYIVVMNFGMGLSPGSRIDNFGHLGGFLGGIAYSYLFGPRFVSRRLRSGRTIIRDEPLSSLVIRDVRNHLHFFRKLLNVN